MLLRSLAAVIHTATVMVPFIQPLVAIAPLQPLDPDPHFDMHCHTWVPGAPVPNVNRTVLIGGTGMLRPISGTVSPEFRHCWADE